MKFDTLEEAYKYYRGWKPYGGLLPDYWMEHDNKPEMGDWALIQEITNDDGKNFISKPQLILVIGHTIWDQALVLEYVEPSRRFHIQAQIRHPKEEHKEYFYRLGTQDKKVDHVVFWDDDMIVLGQWKSKPTFRELRKALSNE